MSAINLIRQRDRVVLVTDGAVWDVNAGIVVGLPNQGGGNPILARRARDPGQPSVHASFRTLPWHAFQDLRRGNRRD
jgi:hypothetical protein